VSDDPFSVLGLPRDAGLSDDDVRAAWRRIAAATHPDRDDGGDPAVYGAAAAAYATLRTADGRGEALADRHGVRGRHGVRDGRGRPWVLALRVAGAVAVSGVTLAIAGWAPASIGVLAGVATWLAATGRHDLPRWAPS
jgi:curved DNA-binding protein CbpA